MGEHVENAINKKIDLPSKFNTKIWKKTKAVWNLKIKRIVL